MSVTKGRIFVIDDNPYSAEMLDELLRVNGYAVETVSSGKEALERVPAARPDLIMLDIVLPDVDGFALANKLKEDDYIKDIPFVFMSAVDHVDTKVKVFEEGGIDYITKPFDAREVLARVERQVTVSRVRMALRESEAKFRSVMESAIDAIISSDISGKILTWNRAAMDVFGYSANEALGERIELIIPERFRDAHREGLERVSTGGASHVIGSTVELAAVRKGGQEFPIELSLATWLLDEKRYFTGIIRDISERKEAEQKFRSVTDSAIDAIISADHVGRIVAWNTAATEILGYAAEEAIGQPLEIVIPERFHDGHRAGIQRITQGGESESRVIGRTVELAARHKNGEEFPIELSLSTWTVHNERYYTGIIRDISERKHAETQLKNYADELSRQHEELKLAQSQLVESEKQAMLGRLVAALLHEINTPLGALRSSADTMKRVLEQCSSVVRTTIRRSDADDAETRKTEKALDLGTEVSEVLSTSTRRIESLVDGLAHFVSLDRSERQDEDVREGIDSALTVLGPQISDRITVKKTYPDEAAVVNCYPARLNQAFLNLLQNAIDAIDNEGEIRVSVGIAGPNVEVLFVDNGRGMSAETLAEGFELGLTNKDGRVRLRLGLATAKRAVEEAGGTLTLESGPGQGAQARIVLPAVKA